ncbi:MAG: FG-GAP-like repeat-containing protein, partial [Bacteroidales bacterium]|nr:FG-GAP-like repeat-containing protein [Bacteroidales bacterium]
MKKLILFLLFICFGVFNVFCQVKVVDISQVKNTEKLNILPDVNGKVLIKEDLSNLLNPNAKPDPIELYPNWPIELIGSSQRGGIYCNLDEDDDLEIIYNVGQQVYAWNVDGTEVDGWPVQVQLYPNGAPAFGDIDGDSEGEVVVSTATPGTGAQGRIFAFEKDGTTVSGFPVILGGGATKTPVLADLDGDDILEIIVEERSYPDGYVGVYKGDGSSYPGFPVMLDYIPGSTVAVGDITGDNIPEIVAESYYSIYAFDVNGNVLEGFPFTPGNDRVFSYSSPVLADLDGDGKREILAGDHSLSAGNGAVHVLKYDGSVFPGWPRYTGYWIYGPPAVGDIDGDNSLDIAIGDQVLSGSPVSKVFVWDKDGTYLPGWPVSNIWSVNNQIIIADLDGDNLVELMWDDNTNSGIYLGYNHDGTPMSGWPLTVTGSSFFMNPFVADVNNDGILDLSGASADIGGSQAYFYLWNTNVPVNDELAILPVLQYNVRHDGVYVDAAILNANFIASPIELCEQEETQFTDQSTGDVISWDWTFEGGNPTSSTEQNPSVVYASPGEYDVTLTVSDGSNTHSISKTDYIKVAYDPVIPDQPVGPVEVLTSQNTYTIYETTSLNADNYTWQLIPDDMGVIVAGDTITK